MIYVMEVRIPLLFAIRWAHKETFVSSQHKGKEHIQWWAAKEKN